MNPSTPITRLLSPKFLVSLLLMCTLLSCSKPTDDDDEVVPEYAQYAGSYSGSNVIDFYDATSEHRFTSGAGVTNPARKGEMTLTFDGERDPRQLVMNGSSFTVKRFRTVIGKSTRAIDIDGSGEFSATTLSYREKAYSASGGGEHVWTKTFTLTKK